MSTPSSQTNRHSHLELSTLLETSRLLAESHDTDFILNNLLLISMAKLLVSRAMVLIYRPKEECYEIAKLKGAGNLKEGQLLDFPLSKELRKQSVIHCNNENLTLPEPLKDHRTCTLFNLQTSSEHLGYLCLSANANGQPFNTREVDFIEGLSIISSVAIANSRMFSEMRSINRRLDQRVYELNTLFDLSKNFNMIVDRDKIIDILKFAMMGKMLINKFFFILEHEGSRHVVASNGITTEPESAEIDALFSLPNDLMKVNESLARQHPFLGNNNIRAVIGLHFQKEKKAVIGVGKRANSELYTESDFTFLKSLGNLALLSIQKTYLLEERIEKERLEEELDLAENIQKGLLPDELPKCSQLNMSADNISSHQVGGDYFDIIDAPNDHLLFAIADVTGKGMPAALLMANLQAMMHVLLPTNLSLARATTKVNDIIYQNTPANKFITFFWGLFNPNNQVFTYVNAGHNPPLLFREGYSKPQELDQGGLILGAMPTSAPYKQQEVSLEPDDLLVFYTDGITEAKNSTGNEEFGKERLINCIITHQEQPPETIKKAIIREVRRFSGPVQSDDLTLMVAKVN